MVSRHLFHASREELFLLVATAVLAGCGGTVEASEDNSTGGTGGNAGTGGTQSDAATIQDAVADGVGIDTGVVSPDVVSPEASLDSGVCYGMVEEHEVPSEPDGIPATPGDVCAVSVPVAYSNRAARVTLSVYSQSIELAVGRVELASELVGSVVGIPTVTVDEAYWPELANVEITNMQASGDAFTFQATWDTMWGPESGPVTLTFRTRMDVMCDGNPEITRPVESLTHVELCGTNESPVWQSSGDVCVACRAVCEMAPSPIVPDEADGMPLALAKKASIEVAAVFGRTLILVADHDGLPSAARVVWEVSEGELLDCGDDVVVWRLPPGAGVRLAQVVVDDEQGVAVASLRWKQAA